MALPPADLKLSDLLISCDIFLGVYLQHFLRIRVIYSPNLFDKITLLRAIPTMTFIHFLTGKSSGILSDISSDILFGILSGISSGI